jgi:hypothetical protein
VIGEFAKDKFPGEFVASWKSELDSAKFEKVGQWSLGDLKIFRFSSPIVVW